MKSHQRKPPGRRAAQLRVALGERAYPIEIGMGCWAGLGEAVARCVPGRRAALVTAHRVGRLYGSAVVHSLRAAGFRVDVFSVSDGDIAKNLGQVERLCRALVAAGSDRETSIVALGGGVVGDLAGFVAATYLRGVSFVQVPTTLLAMVDASVGGKVGVNLPEGKNLLGAFHQPRLVWIDLATLSSLPLRQRRAGFAEIAKAAAIWDAAFFQRLESDVEGLLALDPAVLLPAVRRACEIKAEVVRRDEREAGLRMLLNFGHTLGHAVEKLMRYRKVLHGEAVAMGMAYAVHRSEALGCAPLGTAERLIALLQRAGLPSTLPDFPRQAYLAAIRADKKRRASHVHFVVLRRIGRAQTLPLTPAQIFPPLGRRKSAGGVRRSGRGAHR